MHAFIYEKGIFYKNEYGDYWGYKIPQADRASSYTPQELFYKTFSPSRDSVIRRHYCVNRKPDVNSSKACMLKEIQYPTKGRTVFQFERHFGNGAYVYVPPFQHDKATYVGGFRVKSIKNYDTNGQLMDQKTYEYAQIYTPKISKEYFMSGMCNYKTDPWGGMYLTAREDIVECVYAYFSDPLLPLEVASGLPISYGKVTEYIGTESQNIGKMEYYYEAPYSPIDITNHPDHPMEYEAPYFYYPNHYDKGNYMPH